MGQHLAHSRVAIGVKPQAIKYSMARKLSILADLESGMSEREVAERNGCSPSTVNDIRHDPRIRDAHDPHVLSLRRKGLASQAYYIADKLLETIDDEAIQKMPPFQRFLGFGIMIDKARLIEGLSTENVSVVRAIDGLVADAELLKKRRLDIDAKVIEVEVNSSSDVNSGKEIYQPRI